MKITFAQKDGVPNQPSFYRWASFRIYITCQNTQIFINYGRDTFLLF